MYGTHLKASAAMVRLRLYDVLALLPTQSFESKLTLSMLGKTFCRQHIVFLFFPENRL